MKLPFAIVFSFAMISCCKVDESVIYDNAVLKNISFKLTSDASGTVHYYYYGKKHYILGSELNSGNTTPSNDANEFFVEAEIPANSTVKYNFCRSTSSTANFILEIKTGNTLIDQRSSNENCLNGEVKIPV